jgi:hypothetical protein
VCVGSACYSAYVIVMLYTDNWTPACTKPGTGLEYISTRLAHCLDTRPTDIWALVFCVQVQVLALISVWRRLFASYHVVTRVRECVVSCAVWFILSFAMVVDYRNDSSAPTTPFLVFPSLDESTLHTYAAVCTMLSYTLLHACMCFSLLTLQRHERALSRADMQIPSTGSGVRGDGYVSIDFDFRRRVDLFLDSTPGTSALGPTASATVASAPSSTRWKAYGCGLCEYAVLDWLYLVCVFVFFLTWASNHSEGPVYDTAVHTEWVVLWLGSCMHLYALWQNWRPLTWVSEEPAGLLHEAWRNLQSCRRTWRTLFACSSYVVALLYSLVVFGMAPLDASDHSISGPTAHGNRHATSSWQLVAVVVSTYLYAAILLLS